MCQIITWHIFPHSSLSGSGQYLTVKAIFCYAPAKWKNKFPLLLNCRTKKKLKQATNKNTCPPEKQTKPKDSTKWAKVVGNCPFFPNTPRWKENTPRCKKKKTAIVPKKCPHIYRKSRRSNNTPRCNYKTLRCKRKKTAILSEKCPHILKKTSRSNNTPRCNNKTPR